MKASVKNWADECSSDEGSIDEEHKEDVQKGSKDQNPSNLKRNINEEIKTNIEHEFTAFISNFHFETDRKELGNFFVEQGCTISNLELIDSNIKKSRTAVIKFKNIESLNICLSLSGEKIRGMSIKTFRFDGARTNNNSNNNNNRVPHRKEQIDRQQGGNKFRNEKDFESRPSDKRQENDYNKKKIIKDEPKPTSISGIATPTPATTRPRIIIQPRTLPLDSIGQIVVAKPEIFGGGRPQDEQVYKQEKDKLSKVNETTAVKSENQDVVFQLKSLEIINEEGEGSTVTTNKNTSNHDWHSAKSERPRSSIVTNPRDNNRHRDHSKQQSKDKRTPKGVDITTNIKTEELSQKDDNSSSYIITKPEDTDEAASTLIPQAVTNKSGVDSSSSMNRTTIKHKDRRNAHDKGNADDTQQLTHNTNNSSRKPIAAMNKGRQVKVLEDNHKPQPPTSITNATDVTTEVITVVEQTITSTEQSSNKGSRNNSRGNHNSKKHSNIDNSTTKRSVFIAAAKQSQLLGDSKAKAAELETSAPLLMGETDFEKFQKAQERFGGDKYDKSHSSSIGKPKKALNTFAALNNSDSEDD